MIINLASERSERDTYRGNTIENRGCLFIYLYICLDVCTVCHFGTGSNAERTQKYGGSVFAPRSTPSQFTKQNPPV